MSRNRGNGGVWPPTGVAPATPLPTPHRQQLGDAAAQRWRVPVGRVWDGPSRAAQVVAEFDADPARGEQLLADALARRAAQPPAACARGYRPDFVVVDETHAWRAWELVRRRAEAGARRPPSPWAFVRAAADTPLAAGGLVLESNAAIVTVPPREYVAPPADTRPGWLGRLIRRLFGEPPQ